MNIPTTSEIITIAKSGKVSDLDDVSRWLIYNVRHWYNSHKSELTEAMQIKIDGSLETCRDSL